ncbi:MAG: hypothetical protein IPM54_21585 [Polyangiaceae bacterium]|nr:hypothetical protein [Polyangiaceae bacterium]
MPFEKETCYQFQNMGNTRTDEPQTKAPAYPTDYRDEQTCSAYSILARCLDFARMVPDSGERTEEAVKDNPPRLYRHRQLEALLRAFELLPCSRPPHVEHLNALEQEHVSIQGPSGSWREGTGLDFYRQSTSFEFFFQGYFLMQRSSTDHRAILLLLKPYWPPHFDSERAIVDGVPMYRADEIRDIWSSILAFRMACEGVIDYNGSVLVASDGYVCAMNAMQPVIQALQKSVREIDDILAQIIDPRQRVFSREELIARHGFPDVDLLDIDNEWA